MKINYIGQIFGFTGYDIHCRNFVNELSKHADVHLETNLHQGWERLASDNELKILKNPLYHDGITIMVGLPPFWRLNYFSENFIGYLVWEGSHIPKYWVPYLLDKHVKQIWVPSKHVVDAVKNSAEDYSYDKYGDATAAYEVMKKIRVIPHGVNPKIYFPNNVDRADKFTFLVNKGWNKGWNDRGGVQFAVKAFNEEFSKEESVQMIVKLNMSYSNPSWNLQKEMENLALIKDRAIIQISTSMLNDDAMRHFYNTGNVFVSTSMADGFNMPCLEAMACGLPVITTLYGGQSDFVDDSTGWLIKGALNEVKDDLMYEGCSWSTPNIEEIRKAMREAYSNREVLNSKAKKSLETSKGWTWEKTVLKSIDCLKEINNIS